MISAVLITKDAERHLPQVLDALAWCDEVLVLDSGSRDATCAIAAAHGARVEHQEFLGFGPQKRRACALARHDWILSIDADEVLEPACVAAIRALDLRAADPRDAWAIRRRTFVGAQEIRFGVWNPDWPIRLFHRGHSGFNEASVHESVVVAGRLHRLPGSMRHHSFADLGDLFKPGYARLKAARFRASGRRAGTCLLLLRFGWAFSRSFLLKQGFRDGPAGVVVAVSAGLDAVLGLALAGAPDQGPTQSGSRPP